MAIKLQLSQEDCKTAKQWLHSNSGSEVRHALVLLYLNQGKPVSQVALSVGLHPERVRQLVRLYRKKGMKELRAKPKPGRPEKLNQEFRHRLVELVRTPPRKHNFQSNLWTLKMLQQVLVRLEWGQQVCLETIRNQLRKAGWSYQRAKAWIISPDPDYELKKTPRLANRKIR
jgi:transposase